MGLIIFVRHGESETNTGHIISDSADRYHLTRSGMEQAAFVAGQIHSLPVKRIFSSPVLRAMETAKIISEKIGLPFEVDERLTESGFGPYNNYTIRELPPGEREELGMERWTDIVERMRGFAESCEGTVIAVSHALPIRAIISSIIGLNEATSQGIDIAYCSISCITTDPWEILSIGSKTLPASIRKRL